MANNLFISYDLNSPGQDYQKVINTIKTFGNWANIQKSLWYVNSSYTAEQALDILYKQVDRNDSVIVIDCSNNDSFWCNLPTDVQAFIQNKWNI